MTLYEPWTTEGRGGFEDVSHHEKEGYAMINFAFKMQSINKNKRTVERRGETRVTLLLLKADNTTLPFLSRTWINIHPNSKATGISRNTSGHNWNLAKFNRSALPPSVKAIFLADFSIKCLTGLWTALICLSWHNWWRWWGGSSAPPSLVQSADDLRRYDSLINWKSIALWVAEDLKNLLHGEIAYTYHLRTSGRSSGILSVLSKSEYPELDPLHNVKDTF